MTSNKPAKYFAATICRLKGEFTVREQMKPKWVKLHLARPHESSAMPNYLIGALLQDVEDKYMLGYVVETIYTSEGYLKQIFSEDYSFINKAYVWRVEMLPREPELIDESMEDEDEGGLGWR